MTGILLRLSPMPGEDVHLFVRRQARAARALHRTRTGGRNVGSSALLLGMHMSEERTNNFRGLVTLWSTEARGTSQNGALFTMAGPPLGPAVVLFAGDGMMVSLSRVSP